MENIPGINIRYLYPVSDPESGYSAKTDLDTDNELADNADTETDNDNYLTGLRIFGIM